MLLIVSLGLTVWSTVHNPIPHEGVAGSRAKPARLKGVSKGLVDTVNDWHFAMMNDFERNEAYEKGMADVVDGKVVVDLGSGGGLLSMLAAKHKARHVYSIEANKEIVSVFKKMVATNKLPGITSLEQLSTHVTTDDIGGQKADVLVSEILGTFLLGESALTYIYDARRRLLKSGSPIIPAGATQYVTAVSSSRLATLTSVTSWGGFDLTDFNILQDTNEVVFTKVYGTHLNTLGIQEASPRLPVFTVDFAKDIPGTMPTFKVLRFTAACTCTIHAVVYDWDAWMDPHKRVNVSTYSPLSNFARDSAWGQAIQLLEDSDGTTIPRPFEITKGEKLELHIHDAEDPAKIHAKLRRSSEEL